MSIRFSPPHLPKHLLFGIIALALTLQAWCRSDEIWDGRPGVILLQNRNVLQGVITVQKNEVLLQLDKHNSVRLPKRDVKYVAETVQELYQHQVRATVGWRDGDHLQLLSWCLDNRLLDEAVHHYSILKERIPDHRRLKYQEVELKKLLLENKEVRAALNLPVDETPEQGSDNPVKPASSTEKSKSGKADINELVLANPEVAQRYREELLPIFRNRCGQAGCHGGQSSNSLTFPAQQLQHYDSFHKSLNGALQWVDRNKPLDSPLLRKATTPHGTMQSPAIDVAAKSDLQVMEKIQSWVELVASQNLRYPVTASMTAVLPTAPNSLEGSKFSPTRPTMGPKPSEGLSGHAAPWSPEEIANPFVSQPESKGTTGIAQPEIKTLEDAIRRLEEVEKQKLNRDPFDPAKFNQRYGEPKSPASEGTRRPSSVK